MALKMIARRYAPLDGTWFRTEGCLQSVMRAASGYNDDMEWPTFVNSTIVPLWVRMVEYKAQETRDNPSGMIFGPVVRVGSMHSAEVDLCGHHHAAGLFTDYNLDGIGKRKWIYNVIDDDRPLAVSDSETPTVYACDKCGHHLYWDTPGYRSHRSACYFDGELVCRDCDYRGLVCDEDAALQIARCRELADHLGADHREAFDKKIEMLRQGFAFGNPCQTRLYKDGRFSFAWTTTVFTPEGKKRGMNGGLIQHGPTPILHDDGSFTFREWDYTLKAERDATAEEVGNISWGIHT